MIISLPLNGSVHKILVFIAYYLIHSFNKLTQLHSGSTGLNFCPSLYHHPYFVYVNSKGLKYHCLHFNIHEHNKTTS